MKRVLAAVVGVLFVGTGATPAWGNGGVTTALSVRGYKYEGRAVHVEQMVFVGRGDEVLEQGPFYAYLSVPTEKWRLAPPLPDGAEIVAPVIIGGRRGRYARITVDFTLPDLEPGLYRLDACNSPCTESLGALYPGRLKVVGGAAEARLRSRLDRMRGDVSVLRYEIRQARNKLAQRVERFDAATDLLSNRLSDERDRVTRLASDIGTLRRRVNDGEPFPWVIFALAFAAGATAVFVGTRLAARPLGRKNRHTLRPEPDLVAGDLGRLDRGEESGPAAIRGKVRDRELV
jgi:hypothetical protein